MKKELCLSIATIFTLNANAVDLGTIEVHEILNTKIIENVSNKEVKSADLAESLTKQVPSINLIRRSGIANDIILRGQKRDNITVLVDDAKVYGACPNRMDPPTSHIVTSNIQSIKISEGPFDVENFGSLSGSIKIKTKKPTKKLTSSIETTIGSFGYKKIGASISGGNEKIKLLVTSSYENGDQYKDGNGNTMSKQLDIATNGTSQAGMQFKNQYKDMESYTKKTFMAKSFIKLTNNQELEFSITKNNSDNILYPNSKMDALYDDSDIINLKYIIKDINKYSKKLQFKVYNSKVTHPMSTKYRKSSGTNSINEVISKLSTNMTGLKIINDTEFKNDKIQIGLDSSKRNWDGKYIGYGSKVGITNRISIDDVDTKNNAIFLKYNKNIVNTNIKLNARYNDTSISTENKNYNDIDFNSIDANMILTFKKADSLKYFLALGKASRVPDARELYFNSSMNVMSGTPTLKKTTNNELDLGIHKNFENGYLKLKTFYSKLDNYIYFNKSNTITRMGKQVAFHSFENIDATIYGFELMSSYDFSEDLYLDSGIAYKVGKKDKALTGQQNRNLADISPLKMNLSLNYDYKTIQSKIELIHSNRWKDYDNENGEQELAGYNIVNIKVQKKYNKNIDLTFGIDNIFDKTYAVSNTYSDLILLSDGNSGDVMLLNEPGRYMYLNFKYNF